MIKFIFFIFVFATLNSKANEESAYAEIARLRQYLGGADESDLKVQPTLNQSQDKKKKQNKPEPAEGF